MGMKSSKAQQGATTSIQVRFDGGLNYSQSPSHIADNELTRALNVVYDSQTGVPITRSGTSCVTATALANPILAIYNYEKSLTEKWIVCASGGKLYYLDYDAWVEIGSLNDSATIPSFLTFNTSLLVADGGTNLKKWNGTTLTSLSDGYSSTAISEIGGRVVINSKRDLDLVIFSGIEDETMWDTADLTNPAVGIRAGFGDNMAVNGFAVFGTDLIVSKTGSSMKRVFRISTAGALTEWSAGLVSGAVCAQNPQSIIAAFNDIYLVDDNGFKSIKGVTEYGDLQVDLVGAKINTQFNGATCDGIVFIPAYTALWFILGDRIYAYHKMRDSFAFTDLQFQQGRITSIVQSGNTIYLAGYNGYLYKMDATERDEISPAVFSAYNTVIETKRFSFFGGGILRRTSVELKALETTLGSIANLRANTVEQDGTLLKAINIISSATYLYDATGDLNDATIELADMSGSAWIETCTNRVRGSSIQWQIDSTTGRFGIEGLTAEIALVMG